jgi:hypothetical protein
MKPRRPTGPRPLRFTPSRSTVPLDAPDDILLYSVRYRGARKEVTCTFANRHVALDFARKVRVEGGWPSVYVTQTQWAPVDEPVE